MKYTVNDFQLALLKRAAEASETFVLMPNESNVVWALEERALVKSGHAFRSKAAIVTPDGRYFLEHGKHPKEVEADRWRCCAKS
ncbi:hypothetical protein ACIBSV_49620 [Embleya sp. NPDC050154]|uniref:hypothetical protein n=1 Tax=Embleya sp. NPDC050154 TaxID=3363988 RepID=UPI00379BC621